MRSSSILKPILKQVGIIFGFAVVISLLISSVMFRDLLLFHELMLIFTFIYLIIGVASTQRKAKYTVVKKKYNDKEKLRGFDVLKNKVTTYAFFISSILSILCYLVIEIIVY